MKIRTNVLLLLLLILVAMSSFDSNRKIKFSNQVMVYGLVYTNHCNSEAYEFFSSKLVDANNYYEEQKKIEAYLKSAYPNAKKIRTGSSKHDFGNTASNMCVIKWQSGNINCSYDVVSVHFGITQADALNRAIKHKNTWGGANVGYSIMTQKYW